jgi:2,3-bisphosphoglycerate-dependent phosphoglycerate mutase
MPPSINLLLQNRFTGWVDSNLAEKGVAEAHHAATLLQEGGFTFDRVYSSVLTRAVRTANIVLEDMGLLWVPFHKTWRLNERMCVMLFIETG